MAKDIWLNLPVKDVAIATSFYQSIGFTLNEQAPNSESMSSFKVGDNNLIINFFTHKLIEQFSGSKIANPETGIEVLFSIGADSESGVDEMLVKVEQAGGTVYAKGGYKDGWMYGGGFIDLDGHRWSLLFMDFSKMPS